MRCPKCNEELETHPAGKCLDDWLKSLGVPSNMPSYTVQGAYDLIEHYKRQMKHQHKEPWLSIWNSGPEWRVRWYNVKERYGGNANTLPLAICRATIRALYEQTRNSPTKADEAPTEANPVDWRDPAPTEQDGVPQLPS